MAGSGVSIWTNAKGHVAAPRWSWGAKVRTIFGAGALAEWRAGIRVATAGLRAGRRDRVVRCVLGDCERHPAGPGRGAEAAPWEAVRLLVLPGARIVAERVTLVLTGSDMTARNLNMIRKLSDRAQPGLDWDGRTC